MGRPVVFTRAAIKQIAPWVRDGASPAEIAQRIGCTIGTLRVRCSQLGISLKRSKGRSPRSDQADVRRSWPAQTQPPACFQITLTPRCMDQLQQSARAKGVSMDALARALLEVIVKDRLYNAILDDASVTQRASSSVIQG